MYRAYPNRNGTCLNGGIMPTGTLKWVNASSNATIGGMKSSPAVADGVVYIGSNDGNITAWNATTGGDALELHRLECSSVQPGGCQWDRLCLEC